MFKGWNISRIDEADMPPIDDEMLSSLGYRDELCPDIWDGRRLRCDVVDRLRRIADDFYGSLHIDWVDAVDVTFTGSLANYNWSKYSDIDLHILCDFSKVGGDDRLVSGYFNAKKTIWNMKHDIKVYGFSVEVYLQDVAAQHMSTGVYSVTNDRWNVVPRPGRLATDMDAVRKKAEYIMHRVGEMRQELVTGADPAAVNEEVHQMWDRIRTLRKSGLESGGEMSVENLAFKILRRNGTLAELSDIGLESYDAIYSLDGAGK